MFSTHRDSTSVSASRNLRCIEIDMQPTMQNLQRVTRCASQLNKVDLQRNQLRTRLESATSCGMSDPERYARCIWLQNLHRSLQIIWSQSLEQLILILE
jgi:hypothetical protein